jgi:hypothetical protein
MMPHELEGKQQDTPLKLQPRWKKAPNFNAHNLKIIQHNPKLTSWNINYQQVTPNWPNIVTLPLW